MTLWELILEIINFRFSPEISNPFDFIWRLWLDIYETMTSVLYLYLATFEVPIIGITTSLYELTFGVSLLAFIVIAVIATIVRIYKDIT